MSDHDRVAGGSAGTLIVSPVRHPARRRQRSREGDSL